VQQILFNLLGNAVKFTQSGWVKVAATTTPRGDGTVAVELIVEDTGPGIAADVLPRLFSPFTQGDSSTTRRFGGTGLGLSIVRRLGELMGGTVAAENRAGGGTRFRARMSLPQAEAGPLVRPPVARQPPPDGGGAGRVLVVDDHPINREVLLRQLAVVGVSADAAADGAEALAMHMQGSYAVVLADLHMPTLDGFEMVRRLRAREARDGLARTAVVAVTANALAGEADRCAAADMDGFLAKPITIPRLRTTLARWLTLSDPVEAPDMAESQDRAVDPAALTAWLGDDGDAIAALLGRFVASARDAEHRLAMAVETAPETVMAVAHRLAGAALAVGARPLAAVAAELERAGRAGDLAQGRALLPGLRREIDRVAAETPPA